MTDSNTFTDVLETGLSTSELVEKLSDRGVTTGYNTVRLRAADTTPGYTDYVPDSSEKPYDSELLRKLEALTTSENTPSMLYIGGALNTRNLVQNLAEHRSAALCTVSGAFSSPHEVFGQYGIISDSVEWFPGSLSNALQMALDGEVLLHIDDGTQLDADVRDAILSLLTATNRIELETTTQTIPANLENLTVIFSDPDDSTEFTSCLGGRTVFSQTFDSALNLSENDLLSKDAEISYLQNAENLPEELAESFVKIARRTRRAANNNELSVGLPFRALVDWARCAQAFHEADIPDPLHQSAEVELINVYYSTPVEQERITETIQAYIPRSFDDY